MQSRIGLKILFLALLLLFPIEMGARRIMSDEPYPGLFLPGFGTVLDDGSAVSFDTPVVVANLTNGTSVPLDLTDDLPLAGGGYSVALRAILADPARVNADGTRNWLRQQLSNSNPDLVVESLSVSWKTWAYDPSVPSTRGPTPAARRPSRWGHRDEVVRWFDAWVQQARSPGSTSPSTASASR